MRTTTAGLSRRRIGALPRTRTEHLPERQSGLTPWSQGFGASRWIRTNYLAVISRMHILMCLTSELAGRHRIELRLAALEAAAVPDGPARIRLKRTTTARA